ncbi:MAG: alpha/beta hydrolase [Nitrospiraceae bacterium]
MGQRASGGVIDDRGIGAVSMDLVFPALIVPGIGNSGARHWQTRWERRHPWWRRVRQRDWDRPDRMDWVGGLERALRACVAPPVLIAHSLGCLTVAHWAAQADCPVKAAFLVAPPDPSSPSFPNQAHGFHPVPSMRLPFPSLVVTSSNDSLGSATFARRCASAWGSLFFDIGAAGHINADSDLGDWPEGLRLLARVVATADSDLEP